MGINELALIAVTAATVLNIGLFAIVLPTRAGDASPGAVLTASLACLMIAIWPLAFLSLPAWPWAILVIYASGMVTGAFIALTTSPHEVGTAERCVLVFGGLVIAPVVLGASVIEEIFEPYFRKRRPAGQHAS